MWDLRLKDGLIDKIEKVWATRELFVSYGLYQRYEMLPLCWLRACHKITVLYMNHKVSILTFCQTA